MSKYYLQLSRVVEYGDYDVRFIYMHDPSWYQVID